MLEGEAPSTQGAIDGAGALDVTRRRVFCRRRCRGVLWVVLYIVTQDSPYPEGEKIYAPTRKFDISNPGWKVNGE